ncbi:uncharacterized protein LOC108334344 isoform X1 [Vigna angularis]|uniref:uncharacterized protein LOC108334344 isoform X1 n=1 Tax=Phaseolus angularis TaxID=3914 RepID=UPI000809A650|nr:uncharacterized protein LOC108334344 isoform X1 [Vigna angularis]XP_052727137.1 uncharacterized protein LOC108334344 isoform X1 [Vigna angularis]XP_052727138.1 uncharacterized protein LOC108334344 isoform X1 [Vigna angularis]
MRKKLDTRFPAARIKKIMQADEDVGKIALAVPVLVSKALELFLQDLCDRTYEITLQRGAKTMNALHLKYCVQSYNVFDFLRDIVSRVPDYGHGHGHSEAGADDRALSKRRKAAGVEGNESDEEAKRSKMRELGHTSTTSRGRGRGKGRGRGRGVRTVERDIIHQQVESEPCSSIQQISNDMPNTSLPIDNGVQSKEYTKETSAAHEESAQSFRNIDLNANLNENGDKNASAAVEAPLPEPADMDIKHEEIPGWSLSDADKMAIDTMQLATLASRLEEDDEDYDEEG